MFNLVMCLLKDLKPLNRKTVVSLLKGNQNQLFKTNNTKPMLSLDQIRMIRKNEKRLTLSCVSLIYVIVCVRVTKKFSSFYALGNACLAVWFTLPRCIRSPRGLINMQIPGVHPQKCQTSTMMLIATVFTGAIRQKEPKYQFMDEGRNKMWCILKQ